jgi:hypothetical protein
MFSLRLPNGSNIFVTVKDWPKYRQGFECKFLQFPSVLSSVGLIRSMPIPRFALRQLHREAN